MFLPIFYFPTCYGIYTRPELGYPPIYMAVLADLMMHILGYIIHEVLPTFTAKPYLTLWIQVIYVMSVKNINSYTAPLLC